ncbi:rod shape-determining protein MreC [Branchiibius hedensis]|uniref:Cell shape-determining protein MreC n=1 Tax=Branchiibius hedensis TaxID=672460 RepID=A0A2Y9C104_9MICO|nr:rod shape-determining protein MreC [Branchiibius hedensis]SSA33433.1 rod shape-determining protein MreC [Branchiibius hedensis]
MGVAAAATLAVAVVDQASPHLLAPVREVAADVWSPLQRAVGSTDERVRTLTAERDAADRRLADAQQLQSDRAAVEKLLGSSAAAGHTLRAAQVIAFETNPKTAVVQRITLDVGSDDGIHSDRAVISADGLVGRVSAVAKTSCEVTVVTDPSSVVAARVGSGVLGTVTGKSPTGVAAHAPGDVSVVVVAGGGLARGDRVSTLGSLGGTPYPPGLVIGTVVNVDPHSDTRPASATVRPAIDLSRLDVVGVLTS